MMSVSSTHNAVVVDTKDWLTSDGREQSQGQEGVPTILSAFPGEKEQVLQERVRHEERRQTHVPIHGLIYTHHMHKHTYTYVHTSHVYTYTYM